jgi:hypothetical protein
MTLKICLTMSGARPSDGRRAQRRGHHQRPGVAGICCSPRTGAAALVQPFLKRNEDALRSVEISEAKPRPYF